MNKLNGWTRGAIGLVSYLILSAIALYGSWFGQSTALVVGVVFVLITFAIAGYWLVQAGHSQLESVFAERPNSYVTGINPTSASMNANAQLAKFMNTRAVGLIASHVVSVDWREVTLWHGTKTVKPSVVMPSSYARSARLLFVQDNGREDPCLELIVTSDYKLVLPLRLIDDRGFIEIAQCIVDAMGMQRDQLEILL